MSGMIPGDLLAIADDMVLVDTHRVQLGIGGQIGKVFGENGPAFFITIEGRVNKSQERRRIELMIPAESGYKLGDEIMSRLEAFTKMMKERG